MAENVKDAVGLPTDYGANYVKAARTIAMHPVKSIRPDRLCRWTAGAIGAKDPGDDT